MPCKRRKRLGDNFHSERALQIFQVSESKESPRAAKTALGALTHSRHHLEGSGSFPTTETKAQRPDRRTIQRSQMHSDCHDSDLWKKPPSRTPGKQGSWWLAPSWLLKAGRVRGKPGRTHYRNAALETSSVKAGGKRKKDKGKGHIACTIFFSLEFSSPKLYLQQINQLWKQLPDFVDEFWGQQDPKMEQTTAPHTHAACGQARKVPAGPTLAPKGTLTTAQHRLQIQPPASSGCSSTSTSTHWKLRPQHWTTATTAKT